MLTWLLEQARFAVPVADIIWGYAEQHTAELTSRGSFPLTFVLDVSCDFLTRQSNAHCRA